MLQTRCPDGAGRALWGIAKPKRKETRCPDGAERTLRGIAKPKRKETRYPGGVIVSDTRHKDRIVGIFKTSYGEYF